MASSQEPGIPNFLGALETANTDPYGLGDLGLQQIVLTAPDPSSQNQNLVPLPGGGWGSQAQVDAQGSKVTANDYFASFVKMSQSPADKAQYTAIQKALAAAGYYGNSKPSYGTYSGADKAAMAAAIRDYADVQKTNPNITFQSYLSGLEGNGGGGAAGPKPPPLSLTDPATLRQTLQQAAQNALGRKLSDGELSTFVDHFHGKEKSAYNSQIAGDTYTNPETSGEALDFVDNRHANEEQDALRASYVDKLNQMLGVL